MDNSTNETEFQLRRTRLSGEAAGSSVLRVGRDTTAFIDAGLEPGALYRYEVVACNGSLCSDDEGELPGDASGAAVAEPSEGSFDYSSVLEIAGPDGPAEVDVGLWMHRKGAGEPSWASVAAWGLGTEAENLVQSIWSPEGSDARFAVLEPINVLWADFSASTPAEALGHIRGYLEGTPQTLGGGGFGCGFIPEEDDASTLDRSWTGGLSVEVGDGPQLVDQLSLANRSVTFVDVAQPQETNRGRVFGPVEVEGVYYTIGSFSRESAWAGPTVGGHRFLGFNRARDRLDRATDLETGDPACDVPTWEDRGLVSLPNTVPRSEAEAAGLGYTTGGHDGTRVFVRGALPDLSIASVTGADAEVGRSMEVRATISEWVGLSVGTPYVVRFLLVDNTDLGGESHLLGEVEVVGGAQEVAASYVVPDVPTAVSYHVLAVVDAAGQVAETTETNNAAHSLARYTITTPLLRVVDSMLPPAVVDTAYFAALTAEGGVDDYTWSIASGSLPPGLSLSASGQISGTPENAGLFTFTVRVQSGGQSDRMEFTIPVRATLGVDFALAEFSLIPAGTFQMGDPTGRGQNDERPVHTVTLTQDFYLQKTEVTQRQWRAVMGDDPSRFSGCDRCPVERVSWDDIQTFLSLLNAAEPNADFRLPTEAEWEYAARAGTEGDYGGTGLVEEMGWTVENSFDDDPRDPDGRSTHPVAFQQPNAWDLYDMHGNVWEWIQDRYSATYYSVSPAADPTGPGTGSEQALRGGSWSNTAYFARSSNRSKIPPDGRYNDVGFRLVRAR